MAHAHSAHRTNISQKEHVKAVKMVVFLTKLYKNVAVMKLRINFGMVKLVFCANIRNIGIMAICYVRHVLTSKSIIYSVNNANTVQQLIHIIMELIALYAQITYIIIVLLILAPHAH